MLWEAVSMAANFSVPNCDTDLPDWLKQSVSEKKYLKIWLAYSPSVCSANWRAPLAFCSLVSSWLSFGRLKG